MKRKEGSTNNNNSNTIGKKGANEEKKELTYNSFITKCCCYWRCQNWNLPSSQFVQWTFALVFSDFWFFQGIRHCFIHCVRLLCGIRLRLLYFWCVCFFLPLSSEVEKLIFFSPLPRNCKKNSLTWSAQMHTIKAQWIGMKRHLKIRQQKRLTSVICVHLYV